MGPLQFNGGAQAACAISDDHARYCAVDIATPTPPPTDAQAAYQIALDCLRSHRNRWKASGPQAGLVAATQD